MREDYWGTPTETISIIHETSQELEYLHDEVRDSLDDEHPQYPPLAE